MKILRLDLLAFGPFTNRRLDLSAGQHGLHLLYGPNEAGKSSALRALRQLFYGIDERTKDDFIHAKKSMRVGAHIRHSDGRELEFVRHKARKVTLTQADGETALPGAALDAFLGGVGEEAFQRKFGIDQIALRSGGEQVASGQDAGELLFGAALGSVAGVKTVLDKLQTDADELFLANGRNPKINKAIFDLRAAETQLKNSRVTNEEYLGRKEELKSTQEQRDKLDVERTAVRRRHSQLVRIKSALNLVPRRQQVMQDLAGCTDAVILPDDFGQRHREVAQAVQDAGVRADLARQELARLDEQLAQIAVPENHLANADAIERFQEALGNHRKAMADRPRLVGFRQQLEQEAKEALIALGHQPDLGVAQDFQLSANEEARIQSLSHDKAALGERIDRVGETVANVRASLERANRQLAELPSAQDQTELQSLVRVIQQEGPLEKQRDEAKVQLRRTEETLRKNLAALPLWQGPADMVETLPVPPAETIDRFEVELGAAHGDMEKLSAKLRETDTAVSELTSSIQRFRAEGDVPTEQDLKTARSERESRWQLIRAEPAQLDAMATDYEQAVTRADQVADRLRREAQRAAQLAGMQHDLAKKTEQCGSVSNQLTQAQTQAKAIEDRWLSLWNPLGVKPWPPREMRAWRHSHEKLMQDFRTADVWRQKFEQLEAQVDMQRNALRSALKLDDENAVSNLALLLDRATQVIEQTSRLENRRRELERDRDKFQDELRAAEQEQKQTSERLALWRQSWEPMMAKLGLGSDAEPAEANAVVAQIKKLQTKLREADGNRRRIVGIDRDAEGFSEQVAALVQTLAPELTLKPIEQQCEDLKERLKQARAVAQQRDSLQTTRRNEAQKLQNADEARLASQASLVLLCREAGCQCDGDLYAAAERSMARRQLEKDLRQVNEQLLSCSGGLPLEEFLASVAQADADTINDEMVRLQEIVDRFDKEISACGETLGGLQKELELMRARAKSVAMEDDIQSALAQIHADSMRYIMLRLANKVLQESVLRYGQRNQSAQILRAGELFRTLTNDSFERVKVEMKDEDKPYLVGVRPGGKGDDTVKLDGLSDGGRDQLYLALRLASLEDYLKNHEPLPFIVDDILLNFDDERAAAALQVLADLSDRTQVIVFTHHRHLVDLAEKHIQSGRLFVHKLGRTRA